MRSQVRFGKRVVASSDPVTRVFASERTCQPHETHGAIASFS